ncbi:hypothetical protein A2863_04800 [Candidatus Woesebacteria bacterium RIFCSPHIGHO2_01_FULL_38_9b]|uniref:DHFR domain-containing protein n=2 Tax=Candidatus Woeseibacteriota TaxID=1752722 RepID=A0A1F7Y3C3_9BACT|nr:MAG: hypothetical protein A2863_04800 [Candidatus Woesebacteria bacterium RIFCSPHIGHO2_01_FULL_38_9b]
MKVVLITAMSMDGKIARGVDDPIDWTSKEDKKFFAKESKKAGVILMGRKTHAAIGRVLPDRLNIVFTKNPKKYNSYNYKGNLEFTNKSPEIVLKDLKKRGFKLVILIGGSTLNAEFLKRGLIDEIWITIEGIIFGEGIPLFAKGKFKVLTELISCDKLGTSGVLFKYKLKY